MNDLELKRIRELFCHRQDTYALQQEPDADGKCRYIRIEKPLTDDIIQAHLEGHCTVGVYQTLPTPEGGTVRWICFDVDDTTKDAKEATQRIYQELERLGLKPQLEASGSTDSYHVWLFFESEISQPQAHTFGTTILSQLDIQSELFPKQPQLTDGYGNQVKLPFGIHRKHGTRSQFLDSSFAPVGFTTAIRIISQNPSLPELKKENNVYTDIDFSTLDLRPCTKVAFIKHWDLKGGNGHKLRQAFAREIKVRYPDYTSSQIASFYRFTPDYDLKKSIRQAESLKKYDTPFKCETLASLDTRIKSLCSSCSLGKELASQQPSKKQISVPGFITKDGYGNVREIGEMVFKDGTARFAVFDCSLQKLRYEDKHDMNSFEYVPHVNEMVLKNQIKLPTEANEMDSLETIQEDIRKYIHKYSDVSPREEQLDVYWAMATWLFDKLPAMPLKHLLGDLGTGKTRNIDVISHIAYRAISTTGCVTVAPIYRILDVWHCTLVVDEGDWDDSSEYSEIIKILNSGIEPGKPVMRCDPNNPSNIQLFDVYGPKIVGSRRPFKDAALASKSIETITQATNRQDIPVNLPSAFYEEALQLRNRLLFYRLKNWSIINTDVLADIKLPAIEGRLQQVIRPFFCLFPDETSLSNFKSWLYDYQQEITQTRSATLDGQIVNVIYEAWQAHDNCIDETDFKLTPGDIAANLNMDKITAATVGRHLKPLGIRTKLKRFGSEKPAHYIEYDKPRFQYLAQRYVPDFVTDATGG